MGMESELIAFLFAAGAIVLAEMGDKSQLLAMAFAAKYKPSKVLLGVFIATVVNLGLAVLIGNIIVQQDALKEWIQAASSLSFIFFGLWTLKGEKEEDIAGKKARFGAVLTVALAFSVAELGDKTQLATVALATRFPESPLGVLAGSVAGMMIADAVGIIIGVVLCKRIPARMVKLVSAAAFIIFGLIGCYEAAEKTLGLSHGMAVFLTAVLAVVSAMMGYYLFKRSKDNEVVVITGKACKAKVRE